MNQEETEQSIKFYKEMINRIEESDRSPEEKADLINDFSELIEIAERKLKMGVVQLLSLA